MTTGSIDKTIEVPENGSYTPSMFLPVSLEEAGQEEESLAMLEEYLRLLSGANDVLRTEGMKAFLTALSESGDVAAWLAALSA